MITDNSTSGYGGGVSVGFSGNTNRSEFNFAEGVLYGNSADIAADDIYACGTYSVSTIIFPDGMGCDYCDVDFTNYLWFNDASGSRYTVGSSSYIEEEINESYDTLCLKAAEKSESSISLYGRSLSLGGKIGINYYFDCSGVTNPEDYYVVFTVANESTTRTDEIYLTQSTVSDGNGGYYYVATCKVYFYQMLDDITATLYDGEGNIVSTDTGYSIYTYMSTAMNKGSTKLQTLVAGLGIYGITGQVWAEKNLDVEYSVLTVGTEYKSLNWVLTYDNSGSNDAGYLYYWLLDSFSFSTYKTALSSASNFAYTTNVSGENNGISIAPTLVLDDSCDLKFVITVDDISDYTVYLDDVEVTPTSDSGKYYVSVTDILVQNWDNTHSIKVVKTDDSTVYDEITGYSVMSYAYHMVSEGEGTQSLQDLLVGMYAYYTAAEAYIATE